MNDLDLYDRVCLRASEHTTRAYSTSFSLGVRSLHRRFRGPIHAIYGFVRFADEIVDTFHAHDKTTLLTEFREQTLAAIERGISVNPILHSFQRTARHYRIGPELYGAFLESMAVDLTTLRHDQRSFDAYILGSAEVVGLMCLRVFCEGDDELYDRLRPAAMRLGAAFQKVNFLRDLRHDHHALGRSYFPGLDPQRMDADAKHRIEAGIQADLDAALEGIRQLPRGARLGVYVAHTYYKALLQQIRLQPLEQLMQERVRVQDRRKLTLLTTSYVRHSFGLI
jgi:15-cis-phytoene synthase